MKKLLLILAVAFQVLAVAWIAIDRELILITGKPVTLQTAPIDPRDIFRGDYVSLSYLFNKIQPEQLDEDIRQIGVKKGDSVYLILTENPGKASRASSLQRDLPSDGLFLTGKVDTDWQPTTRVFVNKKQTEQPNKQPVHVRYGIERYYVQQGKGKEIETIQGMHNPRRERYQRPMLLQTRISDSGKAGIEGFSWGKLAFKTEIIKSPDPKADDSQASAVMKFSIKNVSGQPLTLPLKSGNCSFELRPSATNFDPENILQTGRDECHDQLAVEKILMPEESIDIEFDLNNPAWRFKDRLKEDNENLLPLGKLPWDNRMRIHYTEKTSLDTDILSRAFHGRGNID
jgi:uncharacterized membrane-anchored protein